MKYGKKFLRISFGMNQTLTKEFPMEIQISFDNLNIDSYDMNMDKKSVKPATGKQLWKIQNQILRNMRIIDALKNAATQYHIGDDTYKSIVEWEETLYEIGEMRFPITLERAAETIKTLIRMETESLLYHKRRIEKTLTKTRSKST